MDFPGDNDLGGSDDPADDGVDDLDSASDRLLSDDPDALDLMIEMAELIAHDQEATVDLVRLSAQYASLTPATSAEILAFASAKFEEATNYLDRVLPTIPSAGVVEAATAVDRRITTDSAYNVPLMDDAISRSAYTLLQHMQSPRSPMVHLSCNSTDLAVRDHKLRQDARSLAAVGLFDGVKSAVQHMADVGTIKQTIREVVFDNLTYGDVSLLVEIARDLPERQEQKQLVEYLRALEYTSRQPLADAHEAIIDPSNVYKPRLAEDLAAVTSSRLAETTDIDFALAYVATLPPGRVRNAAVLPVLRQMGVVGDARHQLRVLDLITADHPDVEATRAAHYAMGCGTNDQVEALDFVRDVFYAAERGSDVQPDWLGVFCARGLLRLSLNEFIYGVIVLGHERNQSDPDAQ